MILNNEEVTSGQAIDPAAFHDPESGKYFLYWGNGKPVYAELADDMVSLKPGTIAEMHGLNDYREATFVNYRDGRYHLTYSIDDTGSPNYRIGYATSDSPHGPWTYRGVILEKDPSLGILGTGHNSVLQVPGTDDWYMVYHRFAIPDGAGHMRETTIDRLTFDEDGFMEQVIPTLESVDPQFIDPDQSPDPEPGPGDGSEVPGDGSEDPGDGSEDPGDNGDGSDGSTGDGDGSDGDSNAGKQLPRTGADNIALIAMALGLLAAGGAAVWARGRQRAGELLK